MASLTNIEGIGEVHADQLAKAGIGSTTTLLRKGATRQGRKEIARASGVTAKRILAWVNMADLFRVRGVGEEYAELLEACGVDTVPELAQRNAGHLRDKMDKVNERRSLVRRLPAESEIKRWISQAKKLRRVIEY
jgi:predicted flap endonuclease-1-like 5' DNA nuclease